MLFYEPLFLLLFLPIVFTAFLLVRRRHGARAGVLLAASVFFYLWSEPLFVPVVLASAAADYLIGQRLGGPAARGWLAVGVILNVALLATYKYAGFAVDNLDVLLTALGAAPIRLGRIALPVGVSFIVFEKITYLVDISRGRSRPAPSFATYLLYVFLFPKLLAGPIIKYHELEAQLREGGASRVADIAEGFQRFMLGVVKKTLLADTLAAGADMTFANATRENLGFTDAWAGVLFFTLQIYFDFSAYSDMAIGLARMVGFRLRENFDHPYVSCSVTEFWRRWHISLSTWIRDYLYIPLGGNRVSAARQYVNLWVCFLASGLWHGAAWTYVVWGAYNGAFLAAEKLFLSRWLDRLPRVAANAAAFLVTMVGWTIFRAASLDQAGLFFSAMLRPAALGTSPDIWRSPAMIDTAAVAAILSALPRVPGFDRAGQAVLATPAARWAMQMGVALLFVFAIAKALADPFKPFLYFRF